MVDLKRKKLIKEFALKSYSIKEKEKSNITIQGSELNAGMYLYALIADGKVIDTKRMILTK
ncbi:MAG TPA: hypothetical protein PLE52_02795 [Paludibacteraceae bacterium]|nr:hypothetical protein [Paludibacteraceae bacterium]